MRSLWQRVREAFEDNMRQQVTWLGFVFTLTVILIGLAAFASGNNLLFLLLAASDFLISGVVRRLEFTPDVLYMYAFETAHYS